MQDANWIQIDSFGCRRACHFTCGGALEVESQHPAPSRSTETTTQLKPTPFCPLCMPLVPRRQNNRILPVLNQRRPPATKGTQLHRNLETAKHIVYRQGNSASLGPHTCLLCRSHPRNSLRISASPTRIPLSGSTCGSRLSMSSPSSSPGPFWAYYSTPVLRTCWCCFHPHSVSTARSPGRVGVPAASSPRSEGETGTWASRPPSASRPSPRYPI